MPRSARTPIAKTSDPFTTNPLECFVSAAHFGIEPNFAAFFFDLYLLLRRTSAVPNGHKRMTLEAAANSHRPWQVVAISQKALQHAVDFESSPDQKHALLRRGHGYGRAERGHDLFGPGTPELDQKKLLHYFFTNDVCAVLMKDENDTGGFLHWSDLYALQSPYFQGDSGRWQVPLRISERKEAQRMLDCIAANTLKPGWKSPLAVKSPGR